MKLISTLILPSLLFYTSCIQSDAFSLQQSISWRSKRDTSQLLPSSSSSRISFPLSSSISTLSSTLSSLSRRSLLINSSSTSNDEFYDSILSPPSNDPSYKCTHMIGIPLEQNHDLLLELESIQRAVLFHCPLLISSCVAPVVTRMPLLLVDTKYNGGNSNDNNNDIGWNEKEIVKDFFNRGKDSNNSSTNGSSAGENELLTSRDPITRTLHEIVNSVVEELINVHRSKDSVETAEVEDDEENEDNGERDGYNSNDVKPVLIKFKGLEIDGDLNEILHAIGTENEGTILLRNVLLEITKRIEQKGWKAYFPEDNPQGKLGGMNEDGITWRPRIPFMRLPTDFFGTLPDPKGSDGQWQNYSDEYKQNYMRSPEEGGNGISPLFWFKWWDDRLCNGQSVRIRELAVYGRTGPTGMTEQAFYLPHLRTRLPDGNNLLQDDERKDREYDNERRLEQEVMIDEYEVSEESSVETKFEKDMAVNKSNADRRILQTIFDSSPNEIEAEVFDLNDNEKTMSKQIDTKSSTQSEVSAERLMDGYSDDNEKINLDDSQDKKKEKIIQSIAKPIATGDWSLQRKKDKPNPEDNPILRGWKERVKKSPSVLPVKKIDTKEAKTLPLFPTDEHFVGIWKLDLTPKGPSGQRIFGFDSVNESLILRVDKTTAGGPILDIENQHRASGGTWKFFQAEWIGPSKDENDDATLMTRLRIRLLIPPMKEQVLILEGQVKKGSFVSEESISQQNLQELRKSSLDKFVNPRLGDPNNSSNDGPCVQCWGEMWCENVTGEDKDRFKVGRFRMIKSEQDDSTKYQYSIPAPQRYQD